VLVVTANGLKPPKDASERKDLHTASWKMEYYVSSALERLGHDHEIVEVYDDLGALKKSIVEYRPDIVFNLLHEFHGVGVYDHHIAAYLELLRQPYTGCNPRGLMLSRDKVLAKKLMSYHRIPTPDFFFVPYGRQARVPKKLRYPVLVKSAIEEASVGLSQRSVVHDAKKLRDRVEFIHGHTGGGALVEEYIDGRELYLGVLGNTRLDSFPAWETVFADMSEGSMPIATHQAKWNESYREQNDIRSELAKSLPEGVAKRCEAVAKKIYRTLFLTGYARLDCRLREDGTLFCLEANPNCDLSLEDEFASAGEAVGYDYDRLVHKILTLGLSYEPAWKQ
jgi:D-alanine-D-alanine ligase